MYIDDRKKTNKEIIESIKNRSKIENYIRNILLDDNYVEVKTPIINRYADIAPVKQFNVCSPLENSNLYLRIAPTEYLKKLMFMGYDKVFEFSTNFRDDSIDSSHLFEFTSLEIMERDKTVYDKMDQTEFIIKKCIEYCIKNNIACNDNGFFDTVNKSWLRINIIEHFIKKYNININDINFNDSLIKIYKKIIKKDYTNKSNAELISEIIDFDISNYDVPVFVGEFPWYMEGPAKESLKSTGKERYELYYKNLEIANMSSTLVNPEQLYKWYTETIGNKNILENKLYELDPELMKMFEQNMPNSAVVGIGIDRLIMLLLNKSRVSDIVCFDNHSKTLRKEK